MQLSVELEREELWQELQEKLRKNLQIPSLLELILMAVSWLFQPNLTKEIMDLIRLKESVMILSQEHVLDNALMFG